MTSLDMFATETIAPCVPLPAGFLQQAEDDPQRVALSWSGEPWTFGRLADRSRRYATLLDERIPAGGWVAICAERSPEVVGLVMGALLAGRAVVPLEPAHPVPRLRSTLDDAEPALLIHDHTAPAGLITSWTGDQASLDEVAAEVVLVDEPDPISPDPADVAYVIYTSGSTGQPKGVMVQHQQLADLVIARTTADPMITTGDTVLSIASLAFDMMVTDIFVTLAAGARVVLPPEGDRQRDPDALLAAIEDHQVTTVYATPSLLQMLVLAGLGSEGRRKIRVLTGGEAFSESLADELIGRTSELYNGYGPTETTVYASFHKITDTGHRPLGRPIPGARFYPLDDRLSIKPMHVRAELGIGGSLVSAGYHRRAALTADRFRPDPYATVPGSRCYLSADMIKVDGGGHVIFVGRKDSQVKIRGHRVEPGEVEAVLAALDGVEQAAVITTDDGPGGTELLGCYVGGADVTEVREGLRARLPEPMVPARLQSVAAIPLTVNGKLDRSALVLRDDRSGTVESAEPESELERSIAALWCEVLEQPRVGLTDSFFDLGGHSLLAMEIVARIRVAWGTNLSVWELFAEPTVQAWAAALEQALGSDDEGDQVRTAPVSFVQAALCVAEQVVPGSTSPGYVTSADLTGKPDTGRLLAALESVVLRHDSLRTRIDLRGADSLQVVEQYADLDFDEQVVRDRDEVHRVVEQWAAEPFDLSTGPLFRVLLTENADPTDARHWSLHLNLHDVIGDRQSAVIMLQELADRYAGIDAADGQDGPSSLLDLSKLQRSQSASPEAEALLTAWESRLARRAVEADDRFETAVCPATLDPQTVDRLRRRAEQADTDLQTVLLAALLQVTGTRLGALVLDGRTAATADIVGRLASTLLIPTSTADRSGPPSVTEVLRAKEWAEQNPVPAELLTVRLPGRVTVPDAVVSVADSAAAIPTDGGLVIRPPEVGGATAGPRTGIGVVLELHHTADGGLTGLIQYRPSIFGDRIERVLDDLGAVLVADDDSSGDGRVGRADAVGGPT
ncbi:non-ribosomal peptide synthetase [Microlunatus soli]|uniref:Amino acid adenylation domain-containing protein n=1 Tax=Microlunatus soli TaxID=630515 RepID=A0A1H1VXA1_9ACTN|nr:non-ribosomal peptide synthetase [Microlunatus soli]SDS88876.1 amino acid adenylation domain-containing protein [Microlunatus soli]